MPGYILSCVAMKYAATYFIGNKHEIKDLGYHLHLQEGFQHIIEKCKLQDFQKIIGA